MKRTNKKRPTKKKPETKSFLVQVREVPTKPLRLKMRVRYFNLGESLPFKSDEKLKLVRQQLPAGKLKLVRQQLKPGKLKLVRQRLLTGNITAHR